MRTIIQKLKYLLHDTLNSLWQYRVRNTISATIICLSLLILGSFFSLSNNLQHMARELSKNMAAVFFLQKDLPKRELQAIEERLKSSSLVTGIQFINSDQALAKFSSNFPELKDIISNLDINPFPPSFEVSLGEKVSSSEEILNFINEMKSMTGIEDVQFNREWVERMQSLSRLARAIGLLFGGVLILSSFFIISNAIKINVFARKEEITILRMVGATNMFIKTPFLLEGIVLGALGGLLSLFLLFLLTKFFPLYLGSSLGILGDLIKFRYLTLSQSAYLVSGGAVIGFLGSLSSLSRFLKI